MDAVVNRKRNSQPLPALEPPIVQLVTQHYINELSRLLFKPYITYLNGG
jgi:hypothetical protein